MANKIVNKEEAVNKLAGLSEEFAVIQNPGYIHPEFEIFPLAPKNTGTIGRFAAAVTDMDGTTTTTEELCLHSLEFMVRKMSGMMSKSDWSGLDHDADLPFVIGNSTTKHVEYLVKKYGKYFKKEKYSPAFIDAILWNAINGKDKQRREEVIENALHVGLAPMLKDSGYLSAVAAGNYEPVSFIEKYADSVDELNFNQLVRIGIDIYYQRYHQILERIKKGEARHVSEEIFGDSDKNLIEAMPGVSVFLPLIKGWLRDEAGNLAGYLLKEYERKSGNRSDGFNSEKVKFNLNKISASFVSAPAKISIVTSSIFYEADIVMQQVFGVIRKEISGMPLSQSLKEKLIDKFSDYKNVYDAFVTASDSSEIRLKPHRDLYSIALYRLGIKKEEFVNVAGFEDSESGMLAIRAAGIGVCVAVPFAQTSGHNMSAASHVCTGGLPEAILRYNLFLT